MSFPRKPTDQEKIDLAKTIFQKALADEAWEGVWMLSDYLFSDEFNCVGWSLQVLTVLPIPDQLTKLTAMYGVGPKFGASTAYVPAQAGADPLILGYGTSTAHMTHVTRYLTKAQIAAVANKFDLTLDFDGEDAENFPAASWTSKLGNGVALLAHPEHWFDDSIFGTQLAAYAAAP
jgi:hypothetical protein